MKVIGLLRLMAAAQSIAEDRTDESLWNDAQIHLIAEKLAKQYDCTDVQRKELRKLVAAALGWKYESGGGDLTKPVVELIS